MLSSESYPNGSASDKKEIAKLLNMIDLLINGPYIETLDDGLSLRGFANQSLHLLTERCTNMIKAVIGSEVVM